MPFPVDSQWIAATEAKLGVRFPASFVVSMVKMNGGAVDVGSDVFWLYSFLDQTDRKRTRRTCSSICRETATMRELEHFPKHLVVIGHNGAGDVLVLKPMDDDPTTLEHSIYWWGHDLSSVELVADDFLELNQL